MSVTDEAQTKMKAAIEHLKSELKTIRTGRANTAMLDGVMVEVYGSMMRLRDVASVTAPEARQLIVTPYDPNNINVIAKAIDRANLGYSAVPEGNIVRITIPQMNEALRKEMAKICHKKQEEAKIGVRHVRRDSMELIRQQKAEGLIPEDLQKKLEKSIQELTDRFCKEADDLAASKETEIATI